MCLQASCKLLILRMHAFAGGGTTIVENNGGGFFGGGGNTTIVEGGGYGGTTVGCGTRVLPVQQLHSPGCPCDPPCATCALSACGVGYKVKRLQQGYAFRHGSVVATPTALPFSCNLTAYMRALAARVH